MLTIEFPNLGVGPNGRQLFALLSFNPVDDKGKPATLDSAMAATFEPADGRFEAIGPDIDPAIAPNQLKIRAVAGGGAAGVVTLRLVADVRKGPDVVNLEETHAVALIDTEAGEAVSFGTTVSAVQEEGE